MKRHQCALGQISILFIFALFFGLPASAGEVWNVFLRPELASDPAVLAAVEDLQTEGKKRGIEFRVADEAQERPANNLIVGSLDADPLVSRLPDSGAKTLDPVVSPQGYSIRTFDNDSGDRAIVVSANSPTGHTNGLYWIWDRLRVYKKVPTDLNVTREPIGPVRLGEGGSERDLRNALRFGLTWVSSGNTLDLVPWDVEPQATRNAKTREALKPLIEAAHKYHLKYLATGDEIAYHPSLLESMGATLDPADPKLWDMLQEKLRRLFAALPELDGLRVRTGELTRVGGEYRPFDVMHDPEESDWTLDQRYRKFLQTVHEVVVGELDKIYFHRTWAVTSNEQHSDPEVYKSIFTDEVPTKNLYLSPYMSLADRWYYQPFNPTFNQTPHNMVGLFSVLDYHSHGGVNTFPSYPGQYHAGAMRMALDDENSNFTGAHCGAPDPDEWGTGAVTAYLIYRLMWNPYEDIRTIARDYAAIHLGRAAAKEVGEILLLSFKAYKDGIYIKPVAEKITGNTLQHLRLTSFRRRGIPEVDRGRVHIDWLRTSMYEPSIGETTESIAYLDKGLAAAAEMRERYRKVVDTVVNKKLAKKVEDSLELTYGLVETNNTYVKTCYSYFAYRDDPTEANKQVLADNLKRLETARENFRKAPDFCYDLAGVDQIVENAGQALENLAAAEQSLADSPDAAGLDGALADWVEVGEKGFEKNGDIAKKFFHWRGRVDGRDVIHVRADKDTIEHVEADAIVNNESEFFTPLPEKEVTVFVKDVESPESDPFILEQPSAKNDYTAKIYLMERLPSYHWWEFELYYIDENPFENGLAPPWQER